MPIQLSDEQLAFTIATLNKHLPNATFFLFGSRAKQNAKPFSDADILIVDKKPVPLNTFSSLNEVFSESNLPFRIDLVDWHRITPEFRDHIMKEAIKL